MKNKQDLSPIAKVESETQKAAWEQHADTRTQKLSRTRTEFAYFTLIFGASATGVIGPLLVPGFSIIAANLKIDLTEVTLLNGSLVMALGVSAYICNALSTVIGTRLIYIVTTLLLIVSCCWGAAAKSYDSLLAARIFQGLGMGSWFSVAGTTSLTSMFAVHERGRRVGMWNFAVICSVNLAPVISAQVIVALSWRWAFWILAILFGVVLLVTLVALPESSPQDTFIITGNATTQDAQQHPQEKHSPSIIACSGDIRSGSIYTFAPKWQKFLGLDSLKLATPTSALLAIIFPITLLIHPIVLWGCAMWSVVFSWTIIQGAVADQIWEAPPFDLSPIAVGNLVGIAPLVGSALGCILGGMVCDLSAQWLTKRNAGRYEPESRLLPMIPTILALACGTFGLGEAIERGYSTIVTAVFLAILNFGVGVGCTSIVAYTNDACQSRAGEVFGIVMVAKSAFAFGLTFMLNDYYTAHGPRVFFCTFGGLTVGVVLLTLPMYVFGRSVRKWAAERGLVQDA